MAARLLSCLIAVLALAGHALAQDKPNWRDGRQVFKQCQSCHSFRPGEIRFGPSLHGVYGRQAGIMPEFPYSDAMKAKSAAGLVWTEETIDAFITAPKKFIPGTKMTFPGLPDATDRRNVIAYVKRRASRR